MNYQRETPLLYPWFPVCGALSPSAQQNNIFFNPSTLIALGYEVRMDFRVVVI